MEWFLCIPVVVVVVLQILELVFGGPHLSYRVPLAPVDRVTERRT